MHPSNEQTHPKSRFGWLLPASLVGAILLIAAEHLHLTGPHSNLFLWLSGVFLIGSVFSSVHHAEIVSHRIGEPFGAIILALAVTVIEVSLIVSTMLSASATESSQIARDTVFATVMIVLNGVVGLCLLTGGILHREQQFQTKGAIGALSVMATLTTLTLILPNFTMSVPGPFYAPMQLAFVAVVSLALYALFLFVQTVRHRTDFLDDVVEPVPHHAIPTRQQAITSAGMLVVSLLLVILLAEGLTSTITQVVADIGFNAEFVGVVIAAVVLLPEGSTAFRAARTNRVQTSVNLALGSALASIGLSIPIIAVISLWLHRPITLGLEADHIVQIVLTLLASILTLMLGRTTILQGGVHLVIFLAFLLFAAAP
ncbi:ionic antiporter [Kaistia sp. 32K]|uniref:calcium:proton antiporter n=1 Tax=Kaistia sp. 32K TaxID=2795690 RepID=UPI001915A94B|nr:ionic transporter y4hA [Kaistia sp. 32K]BCP51669.1 ionic antiporter [Kaistia sp. 32K]